MGHLWKRNGIYYMRFMDRSGKWRQRSCRTRYKEPAEKRLEEAEIRAACGEDKPLSKFLREYLENRASELGPRGLERYKFCADILVYDHSPLARLTLQEVDRAACTRYLRWRLGHGRSKATVAKEIAWLKAAIEEAAESGFVSWAHAYQLRVKKWAALKNANQARERVLAPREREILFDAARNNENLHAAMTLAFWTGLRQGNILALTEAHFDFTCHPAVLRFSAAEMKNKHGLLVLLVPQAKEVLLSRWVGDPKNTGRPFFQDFRPAWKRLKAKGTLGDFVFHDFRRTYVSYRIAAGVHPKTAQYEVGHKTSKMTMDTYARALNDPAIREWAKVHFRFPWDPATYVQHGVPENVGSAR